MTRLDLALVSGLAMMAIGVGVANVVRSFHTSVRTQLVHMKFGDATIGWSVVSNEWCAASTAPDLVDWCAQPRTMLISTSVAPYSVNGNGYINSRGYLEGATEVRNLEIESHTSRDNAQRFLSHRIHKAEPGAFDLKDISVTESFSFRSLAEGTLLDLCGSIGAAIDVTNIAPDNTCTHHDLELWCGSLRLTTKDDADCSAAKPILDRTFVTPMPMASTFIPVSQKPL